jgi:DNA-directed RNA polymerase specialized sigma24 family protein
LEAELLEGRDMRKANAEPTRPTWLDIFQADYCRLFFTALLVTGSSESAEAALADSLDLIDDETTPSARAALTAVAAASTARIGEGRPTHGRNSSLPKELVAVTKLRPDLRVCFVVRRLVGLTSAETSKLLSLNPPDVERRTIDASVQLARRAESRMLFSPAA